MPWGSDGDTLWFALRRSHLAHQSSGILPWTEKHVQGALTHAFRDAAVEAAKTIDPLEDGLRSLKGEPV